jgi:hypothetical protein
MRSLLFAGPANSHVDVFSLRITEPVRRDAISSSVALKRPDLRFGGTTDSRASSFIAGSARVYDALQKIKRYDPFRNHIHVSLRAKRPLRTLPSTIRHILSVWTLPSFLGKEK